MPLGVGAAVFGIGVNGGSYSAPSRNALAIAVWWAVLLVIALGRLPRTRIPRPALITGSLLCAFALFTVLSVTWAPAGETAVTEFNRVSLYVGVFVLVLLLGARGVAARWSDGLALGISGIAAFALLGRCFPDVLGSGRLPELLPNFPTRLSYPVEYWNGLGILAALGVPVLVRAAAMARGVVWRALAVAPIPAIIGVIYLTSSRGAVAVAFAGSAVFLALTTNRIRAAAALLIGAGGGGVAITILRSRDALVNGPLDSSIAASQGRSAALLITLVCLVAALTQGAVATVAPSSVRIGRPARAAAWGLAGLAVLVGLVALDPGRRLDSFQRSPQETDAELAKSGDYTASHLTSGGGGGRWQFWSAAIDQFEAKPAFGQGAGSFEAWWAQNGSVTYFVRDAHSLWLETLGELGLAGFALLAGTFGVALGVAAARMRSGSVNERTAGAAIASVLVAFMVGAALDWMWELTVVAVIAMICLALLTGQHTRCASINGTRDTERRRPATPLFRGLAAAAASAVIGLHALSLLGQVKIGDSRASATRGQTAKAVDDALAARRLEPWGSDPPLQLALVYEQSTDLLSARTWIARAIKENPTDWRLWLVQARVQTKLGDVSAGQGSLEKARSLNPRSPIFD